MTRAPRRQPERIGRVQMATAAHKEATLLPLVNTGLQQGKKPTYHSLRWAIGAVHGENTLATAIAAIGQLKCLQLEALGLLVAVETTDQKTTSVKK
jgi:hypothetical protein